MSTAKPSRTLIGLLVAALVGALGAWGVAAVAIKIGDPRPHTHNDPLYSYQAPH